MRSKERFLNAIHHIETDRPPIYCSIVPQLADKLYDHFGMERQAGVDSFLGSRISYQELMVRMGADTVGIAACSPDNAPTTVREDGLIINEWGMGMRSHGLYNDFELFPLSHVTTVEEVMQYPFPDVDAPGRFRHAEAQIAQFGNEYGIIADLECVIYETAWYLVGMEKLLMDMALEEPYVDALFDRIASYHTAVGVRLIELGADMIWCGDDLGSQNGPLMSMEMFDRYFAPRIEQMFKTFKATNPRIKIAWHSCGSILPLIPRFIELGLDVLNPIQPLAKGMEPQFLKQTYGDQLSFFGGICVQELLPHKTPAEIKAEIRRRNDILGKGGGYICAPAHNIQVDTSVENVLAFFEGVKELGEGEM